MRRSDPGHRRCRPTGPSGFSLVEALIVVAVFGIVAAIGIPSLLTQLARFRLESTATEIANLMRQTRLRAIRDNTDYTVGISGGKVVGMGAFDETPVELVPEDPIAIYEPGDGLAVCLNQYTTPPDPPATFDGDGVTYQGSGTATGTGAVCVHDGQGNVLQIAVTFPALPPKVRKYMKPGDSPSGAEGFFEKTSAVTADSIWVWY